MPSKRKGRAVSMKLSPKPDNENALKKFEWVSLRPNRYSSHRFIWSAMLCSLSGRVIVYQRISSLSNIPLNILLRCKIRPLYTAKYFICF